VQEKKRKPTTTTHPPTNQEIMDHQQVPSRVGKYELGDTLGEGTFAKVKHGKNKETGEIVAIKVIDKEKILKHKMVDQVATKKKQNKTKQTKKKTFCAHTNSPSLSRSPTNIFSHSCLEDFSLSLAGRHSYMRSI